MTEKYQQDTEFIIDDVETLRILTDVRRQNILEILVLHPLTVKAISKRLNIPVSKLYYHINLLEEKGMIKVVKTQVISGIIEKTYLATAMSYQISDDLLSVKSPELEEQMEGMVLSLLDRVRGAFLESANHGLIHLDKKTPPKSFFMDTRLALTPELADRFTGEFTDLLRRYSLANIEEEDDRALQVFNLFVMAFPTIEVVEDVQRWREKNRQLADRMAEINDD
ncbi:MAG: winged helix-turn-helix domain-containing protein [Ardenticatenaceae bacterium]|nr:winged helix-turn-helix domain-containing protein [Ardenticatenaceae bacterium]